MKISTQDATEIVGELSEMIGMKMNIMDSNAIIIASSDPKRVGTFHEAAHQIISQNLDELVVSDARQVITITVKDASGTEVFTMQESIEEYLARRTQSEIEECFMKFSDSAHAYLHRNDK